MLVVTVLRGTEAVSAAAVIGAIIRAILVTILAGCSGSLVIAVISVISVAAVVAIVVAIAVAVTPAPVTISVAVAITVPIPISVTVAVLVAPVWILITPAALVLISDSLLGLRTGEGGASNG